MQFIKDKKAKPIILVALLMIIAISIYIFLKANNSTELVSANEFNKLTNEKNGKIYTRDGYIFLKTNNQLYQSALSGINKASIFKKFPVEVYNKSSNYLIYVAILLLLSILISIIVVIKKQGGELLSTSRYKEPVNDPLSSHITPEYSSVSFKDIAGISDVQEDLKEVISFLKSPLKYQKLNIRMPKGVLLVGPPGVGKTLIAKAISSEANVPFFYHSGASFVHIYAGMGAKRVKELFKKAQEMAPSIIFIDEIDAVGKDRANLNSDEREATLNQLLVEMDGFSSNSGVIVIGATNRIDVLDAALLRPGRFDRRIFIELPNIEERKQILKLYLKDKEHSLNIDEVAKITTGFSPAALETLINEAALNAIRERKSIIDFNDIESVRERVIFGKKRVPILTQNERKLQSLYQATKAIVALWYGFKIDRVLLLTPLNINNEEVILSRESLINKIKILFSGSIFLNKNYNDIFSIGIEDRQEADALLSDIVVKYSINDFEREEDILNRVVEDIESELITLKNSIEEIANILYEKESISYKELKEKLDALF